MRSKRTGMILMMMEKSRRKSRTSTAPMGFPQLRRLLAGRELTDLVDRDGRAAGVVAEAGDPVRALVVRRVAAIARLSSFLATEAAHTRGLCVFGGDSSDRRRFAWRAILLVVLMVCFLRGASAQDATPQKIGEGVWFLVGDSSMGE
jgi:hypothetical protein